jgi:hypothetical protein
LNWFGIWIVNHSSADLVDVVIYKVVLEEIDAPSLAEVFDPHLVHPGSEETLDTGFADTIYFRSRDLQDEKVWSASGYVPTHAINVDPSDLHGNSRISTRRLADTVMLSCVSVCQVIFPGVGVPFSTFRILNLSKPPL